MVFGSPIVNWDNLGSSLVHGRLSFDFFGGRETDCGVWGEVSQVQRERPKNHSVFEVSMKSTMQFAQQRVLAGQGNE